MILKAAPNTPWNATRIGRLVAEQTNFPPVCSGFITTSDNAVAEDLVIDPRVDLIWFTGSTGVGRRIMEKGAPTLKRLFLQLGGKSADIILEDADFESKLSMAWTMCVHGGQGCASCSPACCSPEHGYDEGIAIMKHGFANVPYGDPPTLAELPGAPDQRPSARTRSSATSTGRAEKVPESSSVVIGQPTSTRATTSSRPSSPDVDNSMTIAREEIFGPVLVVIPFDDDDDAVRLANENQYGLGVGVTSASEDRAMAVAVRIRAGSVSVNNGVWFAPDSPFGGYKADRCRPPTVSRASAVHRDPKPTQASCHRWTGPAERPTRSKRTPRADAPDLERSKSIRGLAPGPDEP